MKKYVFFIHKNIIKIYIMIANSWQLYDKKKIKNEEEIDPYISEIVKELFGSTHVGKAISEHLKKMFNSKFKPGELEKNMGIIISKTGGSYYFTYAPLVSVPLMTLD